ncbi:MAG TPA: amino acid permease [Bacteroidales bacterium]|nr:amino acid permease [Bacteroidales bacterium]
MNKTTKVAGIGLITAIAYVIANMVGTGVFTSLGFQLAGGVDNVFAVMMLWFFGAIIAFTGAQVYGELGSVMPRSGGEYHYLSQLYHPSLGFMSGFFSAFIGFAAPIALASMALSQYFSNIYSGIHPKIVAAAIIVLVSGVHIISVKSGSRFQIIFTTLKILLILFFIVAGFFFTKNPQPISLMPTNVSWAQMISSGFAVSLIFVYYSYSGWNASAYFVSELRNPQKNLPRSLLIGTLVVAALYLLLNLVFLYTAPVSELAGQLDVGFVSAYYIFGESGGKIVSLFISILLISTISSMIFAGPRVIQVMGEDYKIFGFLARKRNNGVPLNAIILQSTISLTLLLTSTFDALLTYLGFVMNLFAFLTIAGVYIHRIKHPEMHRPYKTWAYPILPAIFMIFVIWNVWFMFQIKTAETLFGLLTLGIGLLIYFIFLNKKRA